MKFFRFTFFLIFFSFNLTYSQSFDLIPLGIYGGGDESNLSAYLLGEKDKNEFISLDAGTLRAGIDKAIENEVFTNEPEYVLRNYIKAYFISHGHLDHLSGLIINSPNDSKKNIYALPFTIDILKNRYFTSDAWSNFANEGEEPILGIYTYQRKNHREKFEIEGTSLTAQIFELSHVNPYKSSAILVRNSQNESVLYLGDTGSDRVENSDQLDVLWKSIAPLIDQGKLKAILIETSFDNSRKEELLFGHLTPKLLQEELQNLAEKTRNKNLKNLNIIITHLKPDGNQIGIIKKELQEFNPAQVKYIFPQQGKLIQL